MNIQIQTWLHKPKQQTQYELVSSISETIPGQAMSPLEIMRRWANGLPVDQVMRKLEYFEADDLPNFKKMDLTEKREYMAQNANKINELNKSIKQAETMALSQRKEQKLAELKAQLSLIESETKKD